ncbi:MAG: RICIN domain-containing protein [Bilifractor sp.]
MRKYRLPVSIITALAIIMGAPVAAFGQDTGSSAIATGSSQSAQVESTTAEGGMTDDIGGTSNNIDQAVDAVSTDSDSGDGSVVAENIKTVISACSQISTASEDQLQDLQDTISTVTDQFDTLPEDQQEAMSQSRSYLDAASTAVSQMSDAISEQNQNGTISVEQTGKENSFRYIDGEKITDAVEIVSQEQKDAESIADENSTQSSQSENESTQSEQDSTTGNSGNSTDSSHSTTDNSQTAISASSADSSGTENADEKSTANGTEDTASGTDVVLSSAVIGTATAVLTDSSSTAKGIDVSEHNGTINWSQVKNSGIDFAIIRCGYGDNYTYQDDKQWLNNVKGCEENNIPYGVYIYSYAKTDAQIDSEVAHVKRLLSGHHPSLPVYIDIEENFQFQMGSETVCRFANRFCDQISAAGYKAGLYASRSYWQTLFGNYTLLPNYYHWIAEYGTSSCNYNGNYESWQFSSTGKVNGINASVDMSLWYNGLGSKAAASSSYYSISNGTYTIQSKKNSSYVVDIASGSAANGANVQIYQRNGTNAQKFVFTRLSNGCYTIQNVNSGKVLDVASGSLSAGGNVQQYSGNGTYAQQWIPKLNADGSLTLINAGSFLCLDIYCGNMQNGTNIQQYTGNGTDAQKFVLLSTGTSDNHSSGNSGTTDSSSDVSDDIDGTYYIANYLHQNFVLDVASGSTESGANVQLYSLNRTGAQKFKIQSLGNGYCKITNVQSGKVLDVSSGSRSDGANIQQYTSNGTDAQQWKIVQNSDHSYTFISKVSGKALDISSASYQNGTNIQQYTGNGTYAQKFVLLSAGTSDGKTSGNNANTITDSDASDDLDGTYYIASYLHQNFVLDVVSGSAESGANVQLYSLNRTGAQKFKIQSLGNGYYKITNVQSGKVLDVSSGSRSDGANIQQYTSNGTDAQQWKIVQNSDRTFTIISKVSGKVVDISGASYRNGTNIQQYTANGTYAQKFVLLDTSEY